MISIENIKKANMENSVKKFLKQILRVKPNLFTLVFICSQNRP